MTVHLVDEVLDGGPIVAQTRVPVNYDETPEGLRSSHPRGGAPASTGRRRERRAWCPRSRRHRQEGPHVTVKRALISVSDKTGLLELAHGLVELGVELIATSGTAAYLGEHNLASTRVEDLTGVAEMLGGRVKTLHPSLHGALLARRDDAGDQASMAEHGIEPIDLVVVNLYPFRHVAARRESSEADVVEAIDIGGPAMVRAAAKNFARRRRARRPRALRLRARRAARVGGRAQPRHAPRARRRGVRAHGRLRHRDRELVLRHRVVPRAAPQRARQGDRPRLRREPAPARGVLHGRRRAPPPALDGDPARRQAALVQQPARPRRRDHAGAGVHGAGLRDRQARQPVRRARSRRRPRRPTARRSPPTRRRPSAAWSRSTARSRASSPSSSPSSSSRCCTRPATARARSTCCASSSRNLRLLESDERRRADAGRARLPPRARRPADPGSRHRVGGSRHDGGRRRHARRPSASGATCCSPGASSSTCARTPS